MRYNVATIVASRRGHSQLVDLVANLPPQFGMPIVCVTEASSGLLQDLAASTRLPVEWAKPNEIPQPGHIYVSPPGTSIIFLEGGRMSLTPFGVESTALRPVDSFFTSAARVYGARALGVILSVYEDDGAEGAHTLKWKGGTMLVLDRATAEFYGMADAIVKAGSYDHILTASEVATALRATFTGRDLLESAELQLELGALLESALRASGTNMADVHLCEPACERLHLVAHRGLPKKLLDAFSVVRPDEPCSYARALRARQRVVVEDVFADPLYTPYHQLARETGYCAVQSTPIPSSSGVCGVLSTHYPQKHAVSPDEARALDDLARAARELVEGNTVTSR